MRPLVESMSGTRGIIGENLNPQIALNIALAFGAYVKKGTVIVGGDSRTSHEMLKVAVISGLLAVGINVLDIGIVPTPTVQQMIRYYNAAGGIVITASHNPIIWNGIKLMSSEASFLNDKQYAEYRSYYENLEKIEYKPWDKIGALSKDKEALQKHIDRIFSIIDPTIIQKSNLRVLLDPNNGAGCEANRLLLDRLKVKYEMINDKPNGLFAHNPEPLEKNLEGIISKMKSGNYDIGFVQDADADRLVILDESGVFIGEDYSLSFSLDYILSQIKDTEKKVVVNLSTSLVIKHLCEKHNAQLFYTKIGEANVTQGIRDKQAQVGGEGNGGVIYPAVGWGRDSLTGITIALKHLAEKKQKVSQIVSAYPKYVMLREKYEVGSQAEIKVALKIAEKTYQNAEVDRQDGLKFIWPDRWVHIRPSNTEPIVRVFVEAPTKAEGQTLFNQFEENMKQLSA